MKTFTVTIHHTTNYGAVLQAYALQQTICSMGAENEIFEYADESGRAKMSFRDMLKNPIGACKKLALKALRAVHKKAIDRKEAAFKTFQAQKLKLSRTYTSMDDLRNDPPDAEVLFTGSDQVWRFSDIDRYIEARFLDFGKDNVKKYSYAASLERLNYTDEQKEQVKAWLKGFDGISLREGGAAAYIHDITGYETRRVLDPVFLLTKERWLTIAEKRAVKGPYILCYQVQSAPRMQELVDAVKAMTGYRTVAVLPYAGKWLKTDEALYDVTPEEFLSLIDGAAVVVSASFHGAALGYIFDKPVYTTARDVYANRIKNIVQISDTEAFYVSETAAIADVPRPEDYPFEKVRRLLEDEREQSLQYLSRCLDVE